MTISQKIAQLEKIEAMLKGGASNLVAAFGSDLCASIAGRVINSGESSDGSSFSSYSTTPVPAFWYFGRSRNSAAEAKVKAAAKRKESISYRQFRGFNNLQEAPKNFSFTNEMWRGFGVKKAEYVGGKYVLLIGGKTKESNERIAWMSGQEGRSIIAPNDQELNRLAKAITDKIVNDGR